MQQFNDLMFIKVFGIFETFLSLETMGDRCGLSDTILKGDRHIIAKGGLIWLSDVGEIIKNITMDVT